MSGENPSVNRYLNDKAMDRIDHALGRPIFPMRETYRNHYATAADGELAKCFDGSAHWSLNGQRGDMAFYSVNDAGRKALADYVSNLKDKHRPFVVSFDRYSRIVPERTRAKAKYACYLAVSDTWSELTFSAFCKSASVRSAA